MRDLAAHERRAPSLSAYCFVVTLGVAVYLASVGHGFAYDDQSVLLDNPLTRQFAQLPRLFLQPYWRGANQLHRPLPLFLLAAERLIAGEHAWIAHAMNLCWYALVIALVVRLASEWLSPIGALAAGAYFAVLPLHVEVVAALTGRAELTCAAAMLGAMLIATRASATMPRRGLVLALLSAAALLSKEVGVGAPLLVAAAAWLASRSTGDAAWAGGAALIGTAFTLVLRLLALGNLANHQVHPAFVIATSSQALALSLSAIARAGITLVVPLRPIPDYSPSAFEIVHPSTFAVILGGALLLAITWLALRHLRAPGVLTLAAVIIAVTYAPASNLLNHSGGIFGERALFSPSIGAALMVGAAVTLAAERWRSVALATSFAWTLAAAIVTVISVPAWRDSAHVVAEMIARNPQSYRGWMYRARTEVQGGTLPEARADYDSALARFGDAPELLESAGVLAVRDHDEARATALLSRGLRGDPRSARMRTLLIRLYVRRGDAASAARVAEEGLALDATQRDWRRWLDSLRTAR